nr:transcriptional regulatory protein AlgP-like [Aegilops tauschii subsp. strangulata]
MHRPRSRHCAHLAANLAPPLLRPATAPSLRPAPQRPTRRPPVAPAVDPGPCTALLPSLAAAIPVGAAAAGRRARRRPTLCGLAPLLCSSAARAIAPPCLAPQLLVARSPVACFPAAVLAILRPPRSPASGRVGCAHRGLARPRSRVVAPCWSRPALPRRLPAPASPSGRGRPMHRAAERAPNPGTPPAVTPRLFAGAPALLAPAIWANAQSGAATPDPPR